MVEQIDATSSPADRYMPAPASTEVFGSRNRRHRMAVRLGVRHGAQWRTGLYATAAKPLAEQGCT